MNLIIWRHADAGDSLEDHKQDLERSLSERGKKQASRMSRWLDARLPETFAVVSSPAKRALQTAMTCQQKYAPSRAYCRAARLKRLCNRSKSMKRICESLGIWLLLDISLCLGI